jgi:arylsulfatase A-like enzyme
MPSVSSLFTGLYPVEHGAGKFSSAIANLDTEIPSSLDESAFTLAEMFQQSGFRTGAFVSHPFFISKLGLRQGFQAVHNRRGWWRDLERMWEWVDRKKTQQRFFGYLHFMEAHHRHTGNNEELAELLVDVDAQTLVYLRGLHPESCADASSRRCQQSLVYDAAVLELRGAVARVLQDLSDRDQLEKTMVVVYSDHGEEFWDHEDSRAGKNRDPRLNAGLGHGQSLYQELLHVPLLVWHPGLEGWAFNEAVSLIDVMPSLARWFELENSGSAISGVTLPALHQGRTDSWEDRVVQASGIAYGPEQVATRKGALKSIFLLDSDEFEIYDLLNDPQEVSPLSEDGLLLEFETLTGDYLEREPIVVGVRGELDSGQLEDLKAIGYLQGVEEEAEPGSDTANGDGPEADSDPEDGNP